MPNKIKNSVHDGRIENSIREIESAQTFFDIAGSLMVLIGKDGKVLRINKKGCELIGLPAERIVGKNWFDEFLPVDIREKFRTGFNQIFSDKNIDISDIYEQGITNPVMTKSDKRMIAWHNCPQRGESGELFAVLSLGEDVTDKIRAGEELQKQKRIIEAINISSEHFLHSADWEVDILDILSKIGKLAGLSGVVIFKQIFDEKLQEECVRFEYIWQAPGEKEVAHDIVPLNNPAVSDMLKKIGKRRIAEGSARDYSEEERRVFSLDPDDKFIIAPFLPSRNWNGFICFVKSRPQPWEPMEKVALGTISEMISIAIQRKQSAEELKEKDDYYKNIIESLNSGVVIIESKEHKIVDVNSAAAKLIGASKEEIIGRACHDFICDAPFGECPVTDKNLTIINEPKKLKTAQGGHIPILKSVTRLLQGNKEYLIDCFIDMSEEQKISDELKKRVDELERFNKLSVDRELKMIELKRRNKELEDEVRRLIDKL